MTSDTKLYLAVGILAVLGGAYYLQTQKRAEDTKEHSYTAQAAALPEIKVTDDDIKKIDKFVIETPEEKADGDKEKKAAAKHVLVKQGEEWKLDEPVKALANQANVESLLKNLKTLKVKEQITKDPKDFGKYELGDKEALHATFYKGKDVAYEFWFGKRGGIGQMSRIKGHEGGYVVDGYSSYLYGRDTKGWRDLTIFKFDEKKVKSVELQNEHGTFAFTKDGENWSAKYQKTKQTPATAIKDFEPKKVDDLLRAFKALNANAFGDGKQPGDVGLAEPVGHLVFTLDDGAKRELAVGSNAEGTSRWVQAAGNPQIFSISSWAADWTVAEVSKFQKKKDDDKAKGDDAGGEEAPEMPGMPGMPPGMEMPDMPDPHGE
ncbi:MAG TPA: DUF4340 domain-containing protein [Polyangiaceae bacterium]